MEVNGSIMTVGSPDIEPLVPPGGRRKYTAYVNGLCCPSHSPTIFIHHTPVAGLSLSVSPSKLVIRLEVGRARELG